MEGKGDTEVGDHRLPLRFYGPASQPPPRRGRPAAEPSLGGELTYLRVGRGWRFLAVVLDQYSRRVLSWTVGRRQDAGVTTRVLDAAVRRRHPGPGLIFHSDRGTEYVATRLRDRLRSLGIRQIAACRGPAENAHMESFWHSLKAEVLHGAHFATDAALQQTLGRYLHYYHHRRRHSALGYRSPVDYERWVA